MPESAMGSLNRTAVANFARSFWDIPCPDNKVAGINYSYHLGQAKARLKKRGVVDIDTWKPIFLREESTNSQEGLYLVHPDAFSRARAQHLRSTVEAGNREQIHPDKGLLDCAHYVSVALTRGGVTVATDSAPQLQNLMQARADTRTLAKATDPLNAKRVLESGVIGDGDLIFYVHNGSVHHSAILLDKTKITCHTMSRHPETWDHDFDLGADAGWRYTIVHFVTDSDPVPSALRAPQITGWWHIRFEGRDYYYYFDHPSGRVIWTLRKPLNAKAKVTDVGNRGYWFDLGSELKVFWTSSGNVETMTLSTDGSKLTGKFNDTAGAIVGDKLP